ncbi:MAG: hypothetical protein ACTHMS_02585 [Jatrophihabitans sp.]|uniref:hypothetical protein n=1 Tax=Jatrophihabitans sp. TaxID=1932789 RepID=UPI003F7EBA50
MSGVQAGVAAPAVQEPQVISDDSLSARSTVLNGGAKLVPGARTITHWNGQRLDPNNGVTYSYNMVGADPNTCRGSACDVTVEVDITPINVNIGGLVFRGDDVVQPTLASPLFQNNDYGSTPAATAAGNFPGLPQEVRGAGGPLSQDDAGVPLQLQDATMRAQFARTGASPYHLRLHANVQPTVTITVPQHQGALLQSGRGVVFPAIDYTWWSGQINNLENSADPTHLPLYLTNDVLLYTNNDLNTTGVIGYHGTGAAGLKKGYGKTQGNGVVQTFAWASYLQPGVYARPNGGTYWALQDIHPISHEIAEWADDPFVNNTVEPWLTPTAPQYGCTSVLETGDPVVGIGFAKGTDPYFQGPNPSGSVSSDGYYHPEDEALLPWFLRSPSNATGSEPNQSGTGGRYTLMGDLNPFPGFRQPATGC